MAKDIYDTAVSNLEAKKNNLRNSELVKIMEELDFKIKPKNSGKHCTYTHPENAEIMGNFDGGHGKDAFIKPCYVVNVIKSIKKLQASKGTSL